MENPYAAGELTPELVQEERRRPKFWRGMLVAYGVHHLSSLAGLLVGFIAKPSDRRVFIPLDKPLEVLQTLLLIPVLDLYLILEPLIAVLNPWYAVMPWWWLRALAVFTVPIVVFVYGATQRGGWLWYIGVVSFVVYVSFVMSKVMDQAG